MYDTGKKVLQPDPEEPCIVGICLAESESRQSTTESQPPTQPPEPRIYGRYKSDDGWKVANMVVRAPAKIPAPKRAFGHQPRDRTMVVQVGRICMGPVPRQQRQGMAK